MFYNLNAESLFVRASPLSVPKFDIWLIGSEPVSETSEGAAVTASIQQGAEVRSLVNEARSKMSLVGGKK